MEKEQLKNCRADATENRNATCFGFHREKKHTGLSLLIVSLELGKPEGRTCSSRKPGARTPRPPPSKVTKALSLSVSAFRLLPFLLLLLLP